MSTVALLPTAQVLRLGAGGIQTKIVLDPTAPVFSGRYPQVSLVPGMFLLDAVHQAVLRHITELGGTPLRLAEIRSMRFAAPVLPEDTVTVSCTIRRGDDAAEVTARCDTERGRVATLRLRYQDAP